MLISQQSSTTPVWLAESINMKTEVFFMRELRNTKIIAVDAPEKEGINPFDWRWTHDWLSQKNEGWSDTDGHVFIYFTIEALAEVLRKSQMTVKNALAVLEKQELIFRKRQESGQPNRIYVKLPKETIHYTDRILRSYIHRLDFPLEKLYPVF